MAYRTIRPSMDAPAPPTTDVLRIEPPRRWAGFDFADLWRHRELVGFLAWGDVKVRYEQTVTASFSLARRLHSVIEIGPYDGHCGAPCSAAAAVPAPGEATEGRSRGALARL